MRALGSGGGGSSGGSRTANLRVLVAGLEALHNPAADVNRSGSETLVAALHEEDSRGIVLWAVLRPFLMSYARMFPQGATPPADKEIAESIDVMLDEQHFFLTQQLIKLHLRREKPLSLGGLAEIRYLRDTPKWERYKQTLAREVFDHAQDLQLWHVEVLARRDTGGGSIAGWRISAGQALIDFDEYVFRPQRLKQHQRFLARFQDALKEK